MRIRTASAKSVAATTLEQQRMRVIEPCAEAGCRLATQETSGSCRVPPESRRDADGGPMARTPQSKQLRSLMDFRQIRGCPFSVAKSSAAFSRL